MSDFQISPGNTTTSVATGIIFPEITKIYHWHVLLNQSVLNQQHFNCVWHCLSVRNFRRYIVIGNSSEYLRSLICIYKS